MEHKQITTPTHLSAQPKFYSKHSLSHCPLWNNLPFFFIKISSIKLFTVHFPMIITVPKASSTLADLYLHEFSSQCRERSWNYFSSAVICKFEMENEIQLTGKNEEWVKCHRSWNRVNGQVKYCIYSLEIIRRAQNLPKISLYCQQTTLKIKRNPF